MIRFNKSRLQIATPDTPAPPLWSLSHWLNHWSRILDPMPKPRIVFLCVHNAGRSQMAAAWAQALGGDTVEVLSGGSDPAATVNAAAVTAMREVGIDLSEAQPQRWTD